MRSSPLKTFLFCLLFGGAFLTGGIATFHSGDPYKGGITTTGTVVGEKVNYDSDGNTYPAIVSFTASDGSQHTVTASSSSNSHPRVGSHRQVSYIPSNPNKARVLNDSVKLFSIGAIVIGALVVLLGIQRLFFPTLIGRSFR